MRRASSDTAHRALEPTAGPPGQRAQRPVGRAVPGPVEGGHQGRRRDEQAAVPGHRGQRLVQVDHVDPGLPGEGQRPPGRAGRQRHRGHRAVGPDPGRATEDDHVAVTARRLPVVGRQHRHLVAQPAQRPGQPGDLALDTAGPGQAVGRHHGYPHGPAALTARTVRPGHSRPDPAAGLGTVGRWRLGQVARPVGLEQVPLLGGPADVHLEASGPGLWVTRVTSSRIESVRLGVEGGRDGRRVLTARVRCRPPRR